MHDRRSFVASASALLLGTALTGCSGAAESSSVAADCMPQHGNVRTVQKGTLTVSTFVSPPYTTLQSADGQLGGIDGQIVSDIAKMECLEVHAAPVTGAALTEGVGTGRSDVVIGGVYFTPQRAEQFSLSVPMYRDGMAFISKDGYKSVDEMATRKLGVIQGQLWNADLENALGADHVVIYQDIDSMVADVQVGRVDAGTLTTAEGGYRESQTPGLDVHRVEPDSRVAASSGDSGVILLMNKDNAETTKAFNEDIGKMLQDGRIATLLEEGHINRDQAGSA